MTIQQHPDYHSGFFEAQEGFPLHLDATNEYREGWLSFHDCRAIVETGTSTAAPMAAAPQFDLL